jgi:hypothetical protein
MEFKLVEQTRRLVEVTALLALSLHDHRSAKVIKALEAYAFPEEIDMGNECEYCEATIEKMVHLKQKGWTCVCGKQL